MNRYAVESVQREYLELVALDAEDPPHPAFLVNPRIAEQYYRAKDLWEQAQTMLRIILDGNACSTEAVREDSGERKSAA